MEALLVPDNLDRNEHPRLMIDAPHDLPKTALAQHIYDFVPISEVITHDNIVVASIVIVAKVVRRMIQIANMFSCVLRAEEVDLLIIDDLASLEDVELPDLICLLSCELFAWNSPPAQAIELLGRMIKVLALGAHLLHDLVGCQIVLIKVCIKVPRFERAH